MGKSAGKWIRTAFFRKKPSKASFTKVQKAEGEKEAMTASMLSSGGLLLNPDIISDPAPHASGMGNRDSGSEKQILTSLPHNAVGLLPAVRSADTEATSDASDIIRLEPTAIKGIIRLQALIRGHFVRRQAVATFHCMQGILKLQALIRGRRKRVLDAVHEVLNNCRPGVVGAKQVDPIELYTSTRHEKPFPSAFICKLLASSPTAMPLNLHYDLVDPNYTWNWLERWSSSLFWNPYPPKRSALDPNEHTMPPSRDLTQRKGAARRVSAGNTENNLLCPVLEFGKPKRSPRKALSQQAEPVQGNSLTELERVKQNLRNITASNSVAPDGSDTKTEKPKLSLRKVARSPAPDSPEKIADNSPGTTSDPTVGVTKDLPKTGTEMSAKPSIVTETVPAQTEGLPAMELLHPEEKYEENIPVVDEELNSKNEPTSKEHQRTRRRSFSAKQDNTETHPQNIPRLPSYMAATESAKAKLRGQGSPRFSQDGVENGFAGRHPLPSFDDGNLSSMSPWKERLVHANGKARSRSDRSLLFSRDGNVSEKVSQPAWRR